MPLVNLMRCNSPYRLRYWNWPGSPDALKYWLSRCNSPYRLRYWNMSCLIFQIGSLFWVATVLTVYGIETCKKQKASGPKLCCNSPYRLRYWNCLSIRNYMHLIMMRVATVLTVYGIETITEQQRQFRDYVATVLTVYGIETLLILNSICIFT